MADGVVESLSHRLVALEGLRMRAIRALPMHLRIGRKVETGLAGIARQARFSFATGRFVQNVRYSRLTPSPFMARFIVRTEHMAPHMVQVLGSAGLVDAT